MPKNGALGKHVTQSLQLVLGRQDCSKQVKLIDFSIASLLPKETPEIKNPHRLEGTLAYISPEQTGRMNRGIDYRSDF
ncbi:hypothetical protein [Microseira sp. BLCC-F43]|uniref:hypothetical protein n=1 Tax=Microseira sp. BLCC-F43 TaxID=3153602 RepID=UPI0035BC5AC1